MMAINYAHLVMLVEQGIVSKADGQTIRRALDCISLDDIRKVKYDGSYEDLFFYIERLIAEGCGGNGDDIAGRLHTARSRNDLAMTIPDATARVRARLVSATFTLRRAARSGRSPSRNGVLCTRTQRAQPTTAHYPLQ
jgi:argininosuccinate lyase